MPQPSQQPSETHVRNGILDRDAVLTSLKRWLDTVMPTTRLKLSYKILAAPVTAAGETRTPPPMSAASDEFEKPDVIVIFSGPDQELLLERGAELLLALEYLALRSLRLDPPFFDRIRFDAGDYRALRIAELKLAAQVAAARVRETRQPFRLNPMAARERRIVHMALKDLPGIRTASEGVGEERQVVILPADK